MDVIGFLCVSLGSSTVQFHDSQGITSTCVYSEPGFSSQNGDCTWGVRYRRAVSCCAFLWENGLNSKDINKEIFPVRACLSRKAVPPWWQTFRWWRGVELAETTVKNFYAAGFDTLVKRCGKCVKVYGGYVEKYTFFFRFEYHIFTFHIRLWPVYWLPRIFIIWIFNSSIWEPVFTCCVFVVYLRTLYRLLWATLRRFQWLRSYNAEG
jgi:hypothetical protein